MLNKNRLVTSFGSAWPVCFFGIALLVFVDFVASRTFLNISFVSWLIFMMLIAVGFLGILVDPQLSGSKSEKSPT